MAKGGRAGYMREYRATVQPLKERKSHQEGVREGVTMCCKFLREIVGSRAVTGLQAAVMVDKALIGAELQEVVQRRAMVEQMRPQT